MARVTSSLSASASDSSFSFVGLYTSLLLQTQCSVSSLSSSPSSSPSPTRPSRNDSDRSPRGSLAQRATSSSSRCPSRRMLPLIPSKSARGRRRGCASRAPRCVLWACRCAVGRSGRGEFEILSFFIVRSTTQMLDLKPPPRPWTSPSPRPLQKPP